jgi:hypothetical protein
LFKGGRKAQPAAHFEEGRCIFLPLRLVEVDGQEETRLIQKQRIDTRHEGLPRDIAAGQVPADDVVCHREKSTLRALGAFDARLLADATHPFVRARGRVSRLAGLLALEPARVDVFSTSKQRSKERDLRLGRR